MLVISDNSAISALAEIELLSLLPDLFGEIAEFDAAVDRLLATGFRASQSIIDEVRQRRGL